MRAVAERIAENLQVVRGRIAAAARRSGREPQQVKLVAVTKYVGIAETEALVAEGCQDLGESRPQELWHKAAELAGLGIRWHMIGHLQRNKVRRTIAHLVWLQSGDSLRLLAAADQAVGGQAAEDQAAKDKPAEVQAGGGRVQPLSVLLEVNISGDAAKHGFSVSELPGLLPEIARLRGLRVQGLMAMAALEGGLDEARRNFAELRAFRDRLRRTCPEGISLDELSMGMSNDFEVAIEEGATMVRVGSSLFEGIEGLES